MAKKPPKSPEIAALDIIPDAPKSAMPAPSPLKADTSKPSSSAPARTKRKGIPKDSPEYPAAMESIGSEIIKKARSKARGAKAPPAEPKTDTKRRDPLTGLTEKATRFCRLYVRDFNASRAARDAGYSKDTAGVIGHELLTKPEIQREINRLGEIEAKRYEISVANTLREVATIAHSTIEDYTVVNEDGSIAGDFSNTTSRQLAAIKSVEITEMEPAMGLDDEGLPYERAVIKTKIVTHDKLSALDKLMRYQKILEPDAPPAGSAIAGVQINIGGDMLPADKQEVAKRMAFFLRQASPKPVTVLTPPAGEKK